MLHAGRMEEEEEEEEEEGGGKVSNKSLLFHWLQLSVQLEELSVVLYRPPLSSGK